MPQILKPKHPRARAPQQEKLLQREALAPQLESDPLLAATREKPMCSDEDPAQSRINKIFERKNLPANAGDTGSIPGLGRFHNASGQLSLCAATTEGCEP